jgi:hypothetical protein
MEERTMRAMNRSMKVMAGRQPTWRCGGWGAAEYIVVLAGLMVTWAGAQLVLTLIREHHREFSWTLMVPF